VAAMIHTIGNAVAQYADGASQSDDITMLAVKMTQRRPV
jgi:serine phosphatase RsbU (regulator of sigma subunit)